MRPSGSLVASQARRGATTVTDPDEEIFIVSDFHLGDGEGEGQGAGADRIVGDRARHFASFVYWLAENVSPATPRRLVLLGDTLDLPTHASGSVVDGMRRWEGAAAAAVERIADSHPAPFDALSSFAVSGARLELLAGNHDVALQLPAVRRVLLDRLGGDRGAVGWHPWSLHLRGLLWAEHGSQHHDLHAIPEWLSPPASRSTWGLPPGRAIEALSVAAARGRGPSRQVAAASVAVATDVIASAFARPALARRRRAYRARELPSIAGGTDLPESVLAEIDRLSETDGWSIASRLLRRRLGAGDSSSASFIGPAARRIHAILAGANRSVRVYAFGHTHTPAVLPLGPSAPGASYANAGSWAGIRPAALDRQVGPDRYPFLRIRSGPPGQPTVELRLWNAAQEGVEAFLG